MTLVWDQIENAQTIDQYEIYYKKLGNNSAPASAFEHEAVSNIDKWVMGFLTFGYQIS